MRELTHIECQDISAGFIQPVDIVGAFVQGSTSAAVGKFITSQNFFLAVVAGGTVNTIATIASKASKYGYEYFLGSEEEAEA